MGSSKLNQALILFVLGFILAAAVPALAQEKDPTPPTPPGLIGQPPQSIVSPPTIGVPPIAEEMDGLPVIDPVPEHGEQVEASAQTAPNLAPNNPNLAESTPSMSILHIQQGMGRQKEGRKEKISSFKHAVFWP